MRRIESPVRATSRLAPDCIVPLHIIFLELSGTEKKALVYPKVKDDTA
jgi:hypothetical protein